MRPLNFRLATAAPGLPLLLIACAATLLWRALAFQQSGATLYVDEAQYWLWSRQLDWGYFSKPPGIAALIAASTWLFGDSPLGVKALAMLCYPASALVCRDIARRLYDRRVGDWSALVVLTLPLFGWLGLFASTDALLTLAWVCALWCYLRAWHEGRLRYWLALGLVCGLGLLSKYTMLVFAFGVLLHLFTSQRTSLLKRGPWLAAALALLLLAPNLWWNISHDFPTLRHTAEITLQRESGSHWRGLLEFIASQALAFGPVLGLVGLVGLRQLPRYWRDEAGRLLLCFCLPLWGVVMLQALRGGANANWAAPALAPACLLIVATLLAAGRQRLLAWAVASNLALLALAYHAPAFTVDRPGMAKINPYLRATGWDALANALRPALPAQPKLLADNRTLLAHLGYELRDLQPQLLSWNPDGIAGDHFQMNSDLRQQRGESLVLVSESPPSPALLARFAHHQRLADVDVPLTPERQRHLEVYLLHDFQDY